MNPSRELLTTAAHWFIRVRAADAQSEEYAAWLAWMEADPAHRRAFGQIQETWDTARRIDPPPADLIAQATEASPRPTRPLWLAAACVLIVALGATAGWRLRSERPAIEERVATTRGEHQTKTLPDGSRVELGGLTGIAVSFSRDKRLVVADEGETFYRVERDPHRPFVVKSGDVLVTAIGTAFSVRREADIVSVCVEEGVVEVRSENGPSPPVRARAGERIRFDPAKPRPMADVMQAGSASGWSPGKLRFEGEPLSVVVASLNRYSQREILLGDPSLAQLQFSGTVFSDRIPQWLEGVQHLFPVRLRVVDAHHVVLESRGAGAR